MKKLVITLLSIVAFLNIDAVAKDFESSQGNNVLAQNGTKITSQLRFPLVINGKTILVSKDVEALNLYSSIKSALKNGEECPEPESEYFQCFLDNELLLTTYKDSQGKIKNISFFAYMENANTIAIELKQWLYRNAGKPLTIKGKRLVWKYSGWDFTYQRIMEADEMWGFTITPL